MRTHVAAAIAAGFLIGVMCSTWNPSRFAHSQESDPAKSPDLEKLEASAEEFEAAFNKGDAAAVAAMFMENAQVVDDDGNVVTGRDNIESRFAEVFKAHPQASTRVDVTSLRKITPDIAIEDGYSTTRLDEDDSASRSPYTVIHLRREGKWAIACIHDFSEDSDDPAHDQLRQLDWLVGDWVDQSGDTKVETSCHWEDEGQYLIQNYVVKTREGTDLHGTQRIGWDPERKKIRSWAFDRAGGFVEAVWTPIDDGWLIKADGYSPDGRHASATRIATRLGADLYELHTTQRLIGDELLPDSTVRVARRPPAPMDQAEKQ